MDAGDFIAGLILGFMMGVLTGLLIFAPTTAETEARNRKLAFHLCGDATSRATFSEDGLSFTCVEARKVP